MSLRDQLLKADLVDKKKARKVNRDLKTQRKKKQGAKDRKKVVVAREEAAKSERQARKLAERKARRHQADAARASRDRERLLASLVRTYTVRYRPGVQSFWHPTADGRRLHRLRLPGSLAHDLRAGRVAVAWVGQDAADPDDYVLLDARAARRLVEVAPERICFYNAEAPPRDDPALGLHPVDLPWSPPRLPRPLPPMASGR